VRDDSLWAIDLLDGAPAGAARRVARTGPLAANDGLAMDAMGRVYIAANGEAGQIWRYDPANGDIALIAERVFGAASIAFGRGDFDHHSIYVTTTSNARRGGGKIWRIRVGVEGQTLYR
jgi:sugar lactone lactonase YvrE